jgi:hypothetical protein
MTQFVANAWTLSADLYNTNTTFTVEPSIDVIEDTTGEIQDTLTGDSHVIVGSGGTDGFPPANAIAVTYRTGGIVAGKHVRGRTFLSPLGSGLQDSDGTPDAAALALAELFATTWQGPGTSVRGVIWSRPKTVPNSDPLAYVRFGSNHDITANYVSDQFAVLRSRRD